MATVHPHPANVADHVDFLVMQPEYERAIVRDIVFAVSAYNVHTRGPGLQVSFPLFADPKVRRTQTLGTCVRITGPSIKLDGLALRYEIAQHLRAGRASLLRRDDAVVSAERHERFALVNARDARTGAEVRPILVGGIPRLGELAVNAGILVADEAVLVRRDELGVATPGRLDPLGFSGERTVPVLKP